MSVNNREEILNDFLLRWPIETVKQITLEEYVGVGNKDTFCQWVETKTRKLGSIKGFNSIKFGIYERRDPTKRPMNYENDERYSWLRSYIKNSYKEAFSAVKEEIIQIIQLSETGEFEKIDDIKLPDLFKWKVAFLYSNERLIPVFKNDVLIMATRHYGFNTNKKTRISEMQNILIRNKPTHFSVYDFMSFIFQNFEPLGNKKIKDEVLSKKYARRKFRKGTDKRNIMSQIRSVSQSYIVEQKHNKIQEALKEKLIKEYGEENIILEENYVDIKLIQPNSITFYEVKSSSYASKCIELALGQILLYSFNDEDTRPKKHVVVGQYPPTEEDNKFIRYLKKNLKLEFDYLNVKI